MKLINEYKKAHKFISLKDIFSYKVYDYEEIVKDYIIEHELYKDKYDCSKIAYKIVEWIWLQRDYYDSQDDIPIEFRIYDYVKNFYIEHKELFVVGELNGF